MYDIELLNYIDAHWCISRLGPFKSEGVGHTRGTLYTQHCLLCSDMWHNGHGVQSYWVILLQWRSMSIIIITSPAFSYLYCPCCSYQEASLTAHQWRPGRVYRPPSPIAVSQDWAASDQSHCEQTPWCRSQLGCIGRAWTDDCPPA